MKMREAGERDEFDGLMTAGRLKAWGPFLPTA